MTAFKVGDQIRALWDHYASCCDESYTLKCGCPVAWDYAICEGERGEVVGVLKKYERYYYSIKWHRFDGVATDHGAHFLAPVSPLHLLAECAEHD